MRIDYNNGYYIGEVDADKKRHGYGAYYWNDGDRYEGQFWKNTFHGHGVYYYKNGNVYDGDWVSNQRTGEGTFSWASGDRYEGHFTEGKLDGYGVYYFHSSGSKYSGNFSMDKKSGRGVIVWGNGDRYEGDWLDDERTGVGTLVWTSGDKYEGRFLVNQMEGFGTYYYSNGNKYVGYWKNNNKHGKGTFYWTCGDKYEGDWTNDKRTGNGSYSWANGDRYIGSFDNGKCHGFGTYYWANGDKFVGQWEHDKRTTDGTYYNAGEYEEDNKNTVDYNELANLIKVDKDDNYVLSFDILNALDKTDDVAGGKYVFISYKGEEQDYAEAMKYLLEQENIKTWMAPYDIPAGSEYANVIIEAIENSSCILLLLSRQAQTSKHILSEIRIAFDAGKSIISMHIDDSQLNPGFRYYLGSQQIVPVKSIDKDNLNVKKILNAIKALVK